MNNDPYEKRRKLVALLSIAAFAALLVVLALTAGRQLVAFVSQPERFRTFIARGGIVSRLAMIGLAAFQIVVAIVPGEPFEIAAGYAFGGLEGTLLYYAGVVLGQTIVFLFAKRFGTRLVEVLVSREQMSRFLFLQNTRRLYSTMFFLFLIPGTPKDVLAYVAGVTPARLLPFLLLTSVARLPSVLTSTLGGHLLGTKNYGVAAAVFGATALFSLAGLLLYRRKCRREDAQTKTADELDPPAEKAG